MNTICVTAHGTPGSFVRRVQHDPSLALHLLTSLKYMRRTMYSDKSDESIMADKLIAAAERQPPPDDPSWGVGRETAFTSLDAALAKARREGWESGVRALAEIVGIDADEAVATVEYKQ